MPNTIAPGPAQTLTGNPLPIVALPQTQLLSVHEDDIPWVRDAFGPGIHFKPLRLDLEKNEWVVLASLEPGKSLPMHYHTGPVDLLTIQGKWCYAEYPDQPQTKGCYLYEPGGSVHTLIAADDIEEDTILWVRVEGTNINFAEDGSFHSLLDTMLLRHLTDTLGEEQGLGPIRYIEGGEAGYSEAEVPTKVAA